MVGFGFAIVTTHRSRSMWFKLWFRCFPLTFTYQTLEREKAFNVSKFLFPSVHSLQLCVYFLFERSYYAECERRCEDLLHFAIHHMPYFDRTNAKRDVCMDGFNNKLHSPLPTYTDTETHVPFTVYTYIRLSPSSRVTCIHTLNFSLSL